MEQPKYTLQDLTGYLGIGWLVICGFALLANGLFSAFRYIERYASSLSWTIFVSIPLIVIAYVFGLFAVSLGDMALRRFASHGSPQYREVVRAVLRTGNTIALEQLSEMQRHQRLLKGSSVAFIVIAMGALAHLRWYRASVALTGFFAALLAAALAALVARHVEREFVETTSATLDAIAAPTSSLPQI